MKHRLSDLPSREYERPRQPSHEIPGGPQGQVPYGAGGPHGYDAAPMTDPNAQAAAYGPSLYQDNQDYWTYGQRGAPGQGDSGQQHYAQGADYYGYDQQYDYGPNPYNEPQQYPADPGPDYGQDDQPAYGQRHTTATHQPTQPDSANSPKFA